MRTLVWLIISMCLALGSCEEDEMIAYTTEIRFSEKELLGCWTHSFEESQNNAALMVYRPCDYKEFPVSRYRHTLELKADGKCSWFELAANDAHFTVNGSWMYDEEKQLLEIFNPSGKAVNKYKLVEIGEDFLILTAL